MIEYGGLVNDPANLGKYVYVTGWLVNASYKKFLCTNEGDVIAFVVRNVRN